MIIKIFKIKYLQEKVFFFFLLFFILMTNSHFNFAETLKFGGADGMSYMSISKAAPNIAEEKIQPIHSERFFFPYVFGLLSKFTSVEVFLIYKFFVLISIVLINLISFKIFTKLRLDKNLIFFNILLINLNPYIIRFYVAVPTIINDLIFILGTLIIVYFIIEDKQKLTSSFILGCIFVFASRQSSVAFIISFFITKIKYKKIFNKNTNFVGLSIAFIFFILSYYYSSHTISFDNERLEQYSLQSRLFGFFIQNSEILEKIKFLIWPLLSFGPLLLYFVCFRKLTISIQKIVQSKFLLSIFIFSILIVAQPVLSGTEITGKNVIRLTTLAYIPIMLLLSKLSEPRKTKSPNHKRRYFFIIFLILWSLHPTFSSITIFDVIKF
jgi:hypothetical protein